MNVRPFTRDTEVLYRSPLDDDVVWINAHSDGMCGWVDVLDERTDRVYHVGWSVTGDVRSQEDAREEAVDAILRDRERAAHVPERDYSDDEIKGIA